MLNRTNLLSATNIGLNLGTRSLANANLAGHNIGQRTLMLRQTHPQGRMPSMRDGKSVKSKRKPDVFSGSYSPSISAFPCSPTVPGWHPPLGTDRARFAVGLVPSRAVPVVACESDHYRSIRPDTPTPAPFALVAIAATGG